MLSRSLPAATQQQNKITECNKQTGDKKGDERKAFMQQWEEIAPQ